MSDGQKKSFYKQVFVLLLSWHPECDDMAVEAEVRPPVRSYTLTELMVERSNV